MSLTTSDAIFIVTVSPQRADEIKQSVDLRGVEKLQCVFFSNALAHIQKQPDSIVLVDAEGKAAEAKQLVTQLPPEASVIVMAERFDEDLFLTCHDSGVQDFLVRPVAGSYLLSRILHALKAKRLSALLAQQERLLSDLGIVSERSGVFSTSHMLKLLKNEEILQTKTPERPLSLLVLRIGGFKRPLKQADEQKIYHRVAEVLKECCRSLDIIGEYLEDKFIVILPGTPLEGAQSLVKRVVQRLEGMQQAGQDGIYTLRAQAGIADYKGCNHYEDLINKAYTHMAGQQKAATV